MKPKCPDCHGDGVRDSGGAQPWGEPIFIPCDHNEQPGINSEGETCRACQGNGEIVTDWERYMHPHPGDVGDESVAECPDCDGRGRLRHPEVNSR